MEHFFIALTIGLFIGLVSTMVVESVKIDNNTEYIKKYRQEERYAMCISDALCSHSVYTTDNTDSDNNTNSDVVEAGAFCASYFTWLFLLLI